MKDFTLVEDEKPSATSVELPTDNISSEHKGTTLLKSLLSLFSSRNYPPAKGSVHDAVLIPEATAGWLSILTFHWITDLLCLGYARPLEVSDLYKLQDHRSAANIANKILSSFEARQNKVEHYNLRLARGEISPGWRSIWWTIRRDKESEKKWREHNGKKRATLVWAMNDAVKWWFWSSAVLKVIGDTAQLTSPLVMKAIIDFATDSYSDHRLGESSGIPPIGTGIGLAIVLFLLLLVSSFANHHYYYRCASTGVLLRGGLITAIYSRSLRLTARARSNLTNGKLVNHISTDVSRIDFCCSWFHTSWTGPIQMAICLVILLINLGPSALAGFAFFILAPPVQGRAMKKMVMIRQNSMQWTDKRAKLLQELLGGMRILKYFAWEVPFLKRIYDYRQQELAHIRSLLLIRSANNGVAMALPIMASVVAFVTFSLTGHNLDPAVIFSSLTLFQLLRLPVMFMPMSFSAIADASNAASRLLDVFEAETLDETVIREPTLAHAIEVNRARFTWDSPPEFANTKEKKDSDASTQSSRNSCAEIELQATSKSQSESENVFSLHDITITVPRGRLVAIVGPVGSGKTSLLQGLVGEMRRTAGSVKFGGSVSYAGQSAWIQNATVRENICFGRPWEEARYWSAIRSACLEPDLEMLGGDLIEVGEKGISLSGGQKQRINICRAIYCDTDIQIFDDPLSALDAHVGRAVFQNVLKNIDNTKTRILVTHELQVMKDVDYIYTMVDGRIAEEGTYVQLIANNGAFSRFIAEFGSSKESVDKEEASTQTEDITEEMRDGKAKVVVNASIMQAEERNTGAITWKVYFKYVSTGKGVIILPFLLFALLLNQVAYIMSTYWLVYWQERKWNQSAGFYMGIYAGLGAAQALFFFLMASTFALLTYFASRGLHELAIKRIMYAPMSFFDTTPLGRIMNRFSKDVDTIDNVLGDSIRMFFATFSSILGAVIIISIVLPWFLIAIFCISVCYLFGAIFYRASARELKRLDAILRSSLYTHFSESLSGLTTIRAYGEQERFREKNREFVDIENRAYWLTVTNQRWLAIRLDFLGTLLTFVVAILTVAARFSISPSQTGVVLLYVLSIQQAITWMIRQSAEIENNMNSVERLLHYADEIEQEAPHEIQDTRPPSSWPSKGCLQLHDVVLRYRPELPPVLQGLTMSVHGGEKIGIVGRTGAGKSSIMTALFRIVELTSGKVTIDDVDVSKIGLSDLRSGLSIIPQDPLLFSGTLRANLDLCGLHDDARLWDALKRAYLVEDSECKSVDSTHRNTNKPVNRLNLDSLIEDEGGNLSVGQRSLVSLARALVKNAKILILDEATASVDYETDRKIQDTIAEEFGDRTILCIAHRLRTILSYDKICVLDAGLIAEYDTPRALYERPGGIFRGMCERSSISLDDIILAVKEKCES